MFTNANIINELAKKNMLMENNPFMPSYMGSRHDLEREQNCQLTLNDLIQSDSKHGIVNIPNGSSIAALDDMPKMRAKVVGINPPPPNYEARTDIITDNDKPTLETFVESPGPFGTYKKEFLTIIFIIIGIFVLCIIVNMYVSQKKLEFMIQFMMANKNN